MQTLEDWAESYSEEQVAEQDTRTEAPKDAEAPISEEKTQGYQTEAEDSKQFWVCNVCGTKNSDIYKYTGERRAKCTNCKLTRTEAPKDAEAPISEEKTQGYQTEAEDPKQFWVCNVCGTKNSDINKYTGERVTQCTNVICSADRGVHAGRCATIIQYGGVCSKDTLNPNKRLCQCGERWFSYQEGRYLTPTRRRLVTNPRANDYSPGINIARLDRMERRTRL